MGCCGQACSAIVPLRCKTHLTATASYVQVDLLDRLVIIRTLPYSLEEAVQILAVRAEVHFIPVHTSVAVPQWTAAQSAVRLICLAS